MSRLPTEKTHRAAEAEIETALDALDRVPHRVPATLLVVAVEEEANRDTVFRLALLALVELQ